MMGEGGGGEGGCARCDTPFSQYSLSTGVPRNEGSLFQIGCANARATYLI